MRSASVTLTVEPAAFSLRARNFNAVTGPASNHDPMLVTDDVMTACPLWTGSS